MRRWLPLVPSLLVVTGLLLFFKISKASEVRLCSAELRSVSAEDAQRSYASIAALIPDFRDNYNDAAASWLVSPGLLPAYEILLLADGGRWSAQLRFVDLNEAREKDQVRTKTLAAHALSIPLETALAKRLADLWRRIVEQPITTRSSEQMLDGTSFLVGVGGRWAYTYSPSCGLSNVFVRSGKALEGAIRAGSKRERGERLLNLERLVLEAEQQLTTETTTN